MAVYTNTKRKESNEVEQFLSQLAKETGAAKLLSTDLEKYGCRIFHLFEAEVMNKFEIPLKETTGNVLRFFKSTGLSLDINKTNFTSNLFDYPIMEN